MTDLLGFMPLELDLYGFQSVDILKGPSAVLYGSTPPGGLYDLTSRRPDKAFGGEIPAKYGEDDFKQVAGTVTAMVLPASPPASTFPAAAPRPLRLARPLCGILPRSASFSGTLRQARPVRLVYGHNLCASRACMAIRHRGSPGLPIVSRLVAQACGAAVRYI